MANLKESNDFCNSWHKSYVPLIQKDFKTCMYDTAVYESEGFPFARGVSLATSDDFLFI